MTARRGVTLLELVVALTLTATAALLGTAAFNTLLDRRSAIVEAVRDTERAGARRALLRAWLSGGVVEAPAMTRLVESMVRPLADLRRRAGGTPPPMPAVARGDALILTTDAPTPLEARGVRVRLYVDADPSTPERGLVAEFQAARLGPMLRRELDPDVVTMRVEYLDAETGRWQGASDALGGRLRAARITLHDIAPDATNPAPPSTSAARLRALPLTVLMTPDAAPRTPVDDAADVALAQPDASRSSR